jgi:hypothetical protein
MSGQMSWVLLALFWTTPAVAQSTDPFAWEMPAVEDQLAADTTVIPLGKGALFVPSIAGPRFEPAVLVVDEEQVTSIPTGQRVLIDPGSYVVIVTSGSPGQGVGVAVDVEEGDTTVVPVEWGAVRIEVTDERRVPHRGGYELIRADTREPYGTGFGADTLQGENLQVWLLPPGVYRVVRPGSNYRALTDWATVYVPEGGFVRYRLVTDPDTGEFRAAGVILPDEFGSPKRPGGGRVFSSLVVGADVSGVERDNVVGTFNQTQISGDVFVDGQLAWGRNGHYATTLLQVEEGISQIRPEVGEPLPVVKSRDRVRADALYTFLPDRPIGPYARAAGETQAFATDVLATEDTTVVVRDADGDVIDSETVAANETFRVSAAWAPTIVREGAGVNTRFWNNRFIVLNWRVGLGARQNRYGGAWLLADDPATAEVEYDRVESFDQTGIESTVVANLRLPGWVTYATDLEVFADFDTFTEPSFEWRNTVMLRLTRNLSLNYYIDLALLPQVVDVTQREQSLLLRASFAIL